MRVKLARMKKMYAQHVNFAQIVSSLCSLNCPTSPDPLNDVFVGSLEDLQIKTGNLMKVFQVRVVVFKPVRKHSPDTLVAFDGAFGGVALFGVF